MIGFPEFKNSILKKMSPVVSRLAKPLTEHMGIDYFSYQRVERSGKYAFLANRPDYIDFYMENRFYNWDPYLVHPDFYSSGDHVVLVHPAFFEEKETSLSRLLTEADKFFGFHQTLWFTRKSPAAYESWCFSTQSKNPLALQKFVNHFEIFKKFTGHFKSYLPESFYRELSEGGMDLGATKKAAFKSVEPIFNETISSAPLNPFLSEVDPEKAHLIKMTEQLTERERTCLKWMIEGKTALETGLILGISHRTVERHLENAQSKIGTYSNRAQIAFLIGKHDLIP